MAEGRAAVPLRDLGRGWMEQSVAGLVALARRRRWRDLFRQVDPARVAALAISNQRETVGFLDEAGEELRPAILWLDERCRPDIDLFGRQAAARAVPRDHRQDARPDARRVQPALADALRARALAAAWRMPSTCWAISAGG